MHTGHKSALHTLFVRVATHNEADHEQKHKVSLDEFVWMVS